MVGACRQRIVGGGAALSLLGLSAWAMYGTWWAIIGYRVAKRPEYALAGGYALLCGIPLIGLTVIVSALLVMGGCRGRAMTLVLVGSLVGVGVLTGVIARLGAACA